MKNDLCGFGTCFSLQKCQLFKTYHSCRVQITKGCWNWVLISNPFVIPSVYFYWGPLILITRNANGLEKVNKKRNSQILILIEKYFVYETTGNLIHDLMSFYFLVEQFILIYNLGGYRIENVICHMVQQSSLPAAVRRQLNKWTSKIERFAVEKPFFSVAPSYSVLITTVYRNLYAFTQGLSCTATAAPIIMLIYDSAFRLLGDI